MNEKITSINPTMIKWARVHSGTSIEEAGKHFGSTAKVEAWENGVDYPTYPQIRAIGDYYRKPIAILFFSEPPVIKNVIASFRTMPDSTTSIFNRQLTKLMDDARVFQLYLKELYNNYNPSIEHFDQICFLDINNIEVLSYKVRHQLNAPLKEQKKLHYSESFEYWREKFVSIGVYILKGAFKDDNISGICIYDKSFPVIYVNNSLAPTRQTFTLFHELFHLLYRTSGIDFLGMPHVESLQSISSIDTIEQLCNRFAGMFLVPDNDFDMVISEKNPTEEYIAQLAKTYNVSREVILRKFLDRGIISREEYQIRRDDYNQDYFRHKDQSSGGDYFNNQVTYKGKQYIKLVIGKYARQEISLGQMTKYLDMKLPSIKRLLEKKGWGNI